MPGTATGLTQQGSGPSRNVQKPVAPVPPAGQGAGSNNTRSGSTSSGNYPDVTAGIVDIYEPGNATSRTNLIEPDSVVPDYPMDSLPRHASTHSLPNQENVTVSQNVESNRNMPRSSPRVSDPVQTVVPISSLSSSTGNIPVHIPVSVSSVTARQHSDIPAQVYSVAHGSHSLSPPVVSHSNVSVNVTHAQAQPVLVTSDSRQIRTQDINIGVVSRLDHQRHNGNMLPDLVAHSQPPPSRQISSSQRPPVPLTDPRIAQGHRYSDQHSRRQHRDRRHGGRSRRHSRHGQQTSEEPCKESCYKCLAVGTSFRWILVILSLLGVCCVVTGIVLAALHAAGNSFLFLAIMFIGLGVLLVVVVGVGWKCTPRGHEPLHALFNLGDFRHSRRPRRHRHHRRDGRWHGGSMYPEFQYRRPPPTYNASMQEYQHQLVAAQQNQTPDIYDPENIPDEDYSLPSSPPPSYRSRASTVRAGIQITFPPNQGGEYPDSRPPTYRSHPSNTLQGRHTRPSLSRDDDDDDTENAAPADVAFTGSSVIVDTNSNQNATNIQISPPLASNQNLTVSVTTVSVTTAPLTHSAQSPPLVGEFSAAPSEAVDVVDPVGDGEADRVETAL